MEMSIKDIRAAFKNLKYSKIKDVNDPFLEKPLHTHSKKDLTRMVYILMTTVSRMHYELEASGSSPNSMQ